MQAPLPDLEEFESASTLWEEHEIYRPVLLIFLIASVLAATTSIVPTFVSLCIHSCILFYGIFGSRVSTFANRTTMAIALVRSIV